MKHGVVIVGGGISGLSAAYYLAKAGISSTIVERRGRLGGVIQTERAEGCVIEAGPDSFLAAKPWAMDLIRDLGLAGDVIASNDHLRVTYVVKGGRLKPLPEGLMMMVPTRILPLAFSPLLSWKTKLRMGLEWFRRPAGVPPEDRSVADFIEDHYGKEAVEYLAEPLLAGVYGGDPERLSVASVLTRFVELERKYGSLTKGVLAVRSNSALRSAGATELFRTLKNGLGQLVEAITAAAGGYFTVVRGNVEAVTPGWQVRIDGEWRAADHVILAAPAYEAASVLAGTAPELSRLLGEIEYSSSMTVALGYNRAELGHPLNGFGFLVPKKERKRLVACTWVGTKFSHRVPEDRAVLRCFFGGTDDSALRDSDEVITAAAREELETLMGVNAVPRFVRIARWPRSMAQYTVGHQARIERIESLVRRMPGLYLAGNAYTGIGIPDCVRMGKAAAEAIASQAAVG